MAYSEKTHSKAVFDIEKLIAKQFRKRKDPQLKLWAESKFQDLHGAKLTPRRFIRHVAVQHKMRIETTKKYIAAVLTDCYNESFADLCKKLKKIDWS